MSCISKLPIAEGPKDLLPLPGTSALIWNWTDAQRREQIRDGVWLAPEGALKVGDPRFSLLSS